MKVIGAGFGRTGTESTQAALEKLLGGKCYHMKEVIKNPDQLEQWYQFGISGRGSMNWKALFRDYTACVDWPACNYYKELMEVFPEAKVLLTFRSPEKWFSSFQVLVRITSLMRKFSFLVPMFRRFLSMADNAVWHIFEDPRHREHCIEVYNQHIEEVKAHVPAHRLLVYEVQQGWEPLCTFLGVEPPDEPFPHLNKKGEIEKFARKLVFDKVWTRVWVYLLTVGVCLAAYWLWSSSS